METSMPDKPIIVMRSDRIREMLAIAIVAFGLGVPGGAYIVHATKPVVVIDPRMERVCGWPTREGEYLWAMVEEGKVKCGRYM